MGRRAHKRPHEQSNGIDSPLRKFVNAFEFETPMLDEVDFLVDILLSAGLT